MASIIGLIITLFVANRVYKINLKIDNSKSDEQKNSNISIIQRDNKQGNNIS